MGLKYNLVVLILFCWFHACTQSINVGSARALGMVYEDELGLFDNNQAYHFQFRSGFRPLAIGLEFRTIDWGNQMGISLLFNKYRMINEKWGVQYDIGMIHSLALFRPSFKYSLGLLGRAAIACNLKEKHRLELGLGLRYDRIIAYDDFSPINQTLELPISLSLTRLIFTKKEE